MLVNHLLNTKPKIMKKTLVSIILVLAFTALQAQFGVKGGINLANWAGDDVDEEGKKALIGPYFGFFYNIECADMFSIQPELVYSSQGVKYELMGQSAKIAASYLNLTALARLNTSSGFFVGIGPQIGFLLSAKIKEDGSDDLDIKDEMKGTDIAAAIAAGYELESGFGFYARYNHSFSKLLEDDSKAYNRVFQVGLRYTIGKKAGE